ncbi:MAG: hypothetical protein HYV96_21340 [Opitutae bacterium]|nr:hypothetical protein [Opitutae bacterium]
MSFDQRIWWLSFAVLLAAGAALSRVAPAAPAMPGVLPRVIADWSWLRTNVAWEARDEARARAWSEVAIAAAPQLDYFRVNAARMRAFDIPAWREAAAPEAPAAVRVRWREEAANDALALLLADPEPSAARLIEAGNISLYAKRDPAAAAEFYRRAAELPDAPWHAGRIYAELLRQTGRSREALAWLRAWLPRLPVDDPAAQCELVHARMVELERELGSEREAL